VAKERSFGHSVENHDQKNDFLVVAQKIMTKMITIWPCGFLLVAKERSFGRSVENHDQKNDWMVVAGICKIIKIVKQ